MITNKTVIPIVALAVAAILATAADAPAQLSRGDVVVPPVTLGSIADNHQELWIRLNDLWFAIPQSRQPAEARKEFARFIREEVLEVLHREGVELYPVFDSLTAGNYATVAALFDREMIEHLATEMEAAAPRNPGVFGGRAYALSMLLQSYLRKTDTIVLPVIQVLLTPSALQTLVARLDTSERN